MPITVRHTPVGLLTRLAVESGQVRRRDIQAQRAIRLQDIQARRDTRLQEIAWAGEERGANIAARQEAQLEAQLKAQKFALQKLGASQIAQQRPVSEKAKVDRESLYDAVSSAESAGIYRPEQIQQMKIFADLGDKSGVRAILGDLPSVSSRRRELIRQTKVIDRVAQSRLTPIWEQISEIDKQVDKQFDAKGLELLRQNPRWMPENIKELLAQRQELENQASQIKDQMNQTKQMLDYGISLPEQMEARAKRDQQMAKILVDERKRQMSASVGLTPRQKLVIDMVRDNRKDERRRINKNITDLESEMLPFLDSEGQPTESPNDYQKRIEPLKLRKLELENWRVKSENKERSEIEAILKPEVVKATAKTKYELNKVYRSASGKRIKYIGKNREGQKQFQEID